MHEKQEGALSENKEGEVSIKKECVSFVDNKYARLIDGSVFH